MYIKFIESGGVGFFNIFAKKISWPIDYHRSKIFMVQ